MKHCLASSISRIGYRIKKDLFNRKSYEPSITGLVRQEFLNDSFTVELLSIVNLNDGDWLLRPKVKYLLTSSLSLKAGAGILVAVATVYLGSLTTGIECIWDLN